MKSIREDINKCRSAIGSKVNREIHRDMWDQVYRNVWKAVSSIRYDILYPIRDSKDVEK